MRLVVGVDTGVHYKAALNLAARLRFANPQWTLAHSVDLSLPIAGSGFGIEGAFGIDSMTFANDLGRKALERARDDACAHGINAEAVMLAGNAASSLMDYADEVEADLVVVQSERKHGLGAMFLGSVSRGLAIGARQSALISKGEVSPTGDLHAVFATDLSDYSKRAIDKFLELHPEGIKAIRLVYAFHLGVAGPDQSDGVGFIEAKLIEDASAQLSELAAKIKAAGYACTFAVIDLPVSDAINQSMTQSKADLLVLGAQGHGFMHRLVLGSTALHQVVDEPHPVLLIRP